MKKRNKTGQGEIEEEDDPSAEDNDIDCVDCHRKYKLVDGSSNCRCKRCNILYNINGSYLHKPMPHGRFGRVAKKI